MPLLATLFSRGLGHEQTVLTLILAFLLPIYRPLGGITWLRRRGQRSISASYVKATRRYRIPSQFTHRSKQGSRPIKKTYIRWNQGERKALLDDDDGDGDAVGVLGHLSGICWRAYAVTCKFCAV